MPKRSCGAAESKRPGARAAVGGTTPRAGGVFDGAERSPQGEEAGGADESNPLMEWVGLECLGRGAAWEGQLRGSCKPHGRSGAKAIGTSGLIQEEL